jgi:RNA polymerase sigma factor (sigma-70 family)
MCPSNPESFTTSVSSGIRQLTHVQVKILRAFIHKRVMNTDDVDDILQGTFLEALRSEHKFRNASQPQTWLCGIALNLIRSHFRRVYREPGQESWDDSLHSDLDSQTDLSHQVNDHRELLRTMTAIRGLPKNMQKVIEVAVDTGGNYQETALSLGIPIGTVRSRLSRARQQLKNQLAPFV